MTSGQRVFMKISQERQNTESEFDLVLSYRWLLEGIFLPAIGCIGLIGKEIKIPATK